MPVSNLQTSANDWVLVLSLISIVSCWLYIQTQSLWRAVALDEVRIPFYLLCLPLTVISTLPEERSKAWQDIWLSCPPVPFPCPLAMPVSTGWEGIILLPSGGIFSSPTCCWATSSPLQGTRWVTQWLWGCEVSGRPQISPGLPGLQDCVHQGAESPALLMEHKTQAFFKKINK